MTPANQRPGAATTAPNQTTIPTGPVDPTFLRVLDEHQAEVVTAIAAAIRDAGLGTDLSGYGEGGWHDAHDDLDDVDAVEIALDAYRRMRREPDVASHLRHQQAAAFHEVDLDDIVLDDLADLERALHGAWTADTAADRNQWLRNQTRPETGQCAVTAMVVQDRFGGDLLRVVNDGDSHYYNRLPDGREVDLTRGQFDTWAPSEEPAVRPRSYLEGNEGTMRRYQLLEANLSARGA